MKHGTEVEHMLKAWAVAGLALDKAGHKELPDDSVADRMPLAELEALELPDDALDPIAAARLALRARPADGGPTPKPKAKRQRRR